MVTVVAIYDLECTDCWFEEAVYGDLDDALDEVEAHRKRQRAGPREHFVNLHRRE